MKSPAPRPIGTTPSNVGSVPPMPRMVKRPGCRTSSEVPPVSMPGTQRRRSLRSVGLRSRMKSAVSVSTTVGSRSGGSAVKVAPETVSGRYFESALASTVTVPRSANVLVDAEPSARASPAAATETTSISAFMPL